MTNPQTTVENLLRLADPSKGATPAEALNSALRAQEISIKYMLPVAIRARAARIARQASKRG